MQIEAHKWMHADTHSTINTDYLLLEKTVKQQKVKQLTAWLYPR